MTLGADVRSRVNHLTVLHRRWCLLSFGGKCFVFVNFLNIYKYSLKVRRGVMLCHLFSRHACSPGPLNKSSSLFLLRGKRLRHSWVLGVTSCWCWRRRKFHVSVSLRQVKALVMKAGGCYIRGGQENSLLLQNSSGAFYKCYEFKRRINPWLFHTKLCRPTPIFVPAAKT